MLLIQPETDVAPGTQAWVSASFNIKGLGTGLIVADARAVAELGNGRLGQAEKICAYTHSHLDVAAAVVWAGVVWAGVVWSRVVAYSCRHRRCESDRSEAT